MLDYILERCLHAPVAVSKAQGQATGEAFLVIKPRDKPLVKLIGSGAYYSVSSGLFTNNGLFLQNNHYKNKNYVFVGLGIRSLVFCANTLF